MSAENCNGFMSIFTSSEREAVLVRAFALILALSACLIVSAADINIALLAAIILVLALAVRVILCAVITAFFG